MARSVNKVFLLGNVTRDPELRYTPDGQAVCSFGIATNRVWKNQNGEQQESAEFTNLVAWAKVAEILAQFVHKGDKLCIEGRLQTRKWTDKENITRYTTEVVVRDFVLLGNKPEQVEGGEDIVKQAEEIMGGEAEPVVEAALAEPSGEPVPDETKSPKKGKKSEEANPDDILR